MLMGASSTSYILALRPLLKVGKRGHSSFQGLRDDKSPKEVGREIAEVPAKTQTRTAKPTPQR